MERVAFIIEKTGERIGCMLNPETLVARRSAGLLRRNGVSGPLQTTRLTDDPLLYTGGGATEMILDLLFDTTLAGGTWLRMRFRRVNSEKEPVEQTAPIPDLDGFDPVGGFPTSSAVEVTGGESPDESGTPSPTRLDAIAYQKYGRANMWRVVAWFNRIADPLRIESGTLLRMPQMESVQNASQKENA